MYISNSNLSSSCACSFCITDRASPSISTTNSPRSNPSRIAWRHTIASATKTYNNPIVNFVLFISKNPRILPNRNFLSITNPPS
ncbi:hypothetical protein F383_16993 [Gossypium arboreum]|uniref:Uncharacterized protein n=1 Tax=Gossypium arboreum TaxID=29729 RepID=A0A0B0NP07_GOSAR|nr:hypothetical protein F383_16993 [Gossypium arboreum]